MIRKTALVALVLGLALALAPSLASAKHVRFGGPHPVHVKFGGGYCYIEVAHVHAYAPDRPALYSEQDGNYVFTGDPTPFGYEGDKHPFYGHHPVPGAGAAVYCYMDGPHYHPYEPPSAPEYKVEKGVAFYIGPFAPVYYQEKPRRVKMVSAEYRPFVSVRPVVEVAPPPEYHGDVWVAPGAPQVVVNAPPPVVVAPQPTRAVVVAPPAPHIVVAPPAPHIVVAPPRPVVVAPPRPVIVAPAPGVYVDHHHHGKVKWGHQGKVKWKHDNGRHRGWYKH